MRADPGNTSTAVRAALVAAGRELTANGAIALALADRMDRSAGVVGFAALAKQLRAAMSAALSGAPVAADPVDDLRARRSHKLRGNT